MVDVPSTALFISPGTGPIGDVNSPSGIKLDDEAMAPRHGPAELNTGAMIAATVWGVGPRRQPSRLHGGRYRGRVWDRQSLLQVGLAADDALGRSDHLRRRSVSARDPVLGPLRAGFQCGCVGPGALRGVAIGSCLLRRLRCLRHCRRCRQPGHAVASLIGRAQRSAVVDSRSSV